MPFSSRVRGRTVGWRLARACVFNGGNEGWGWQWGLRWEDEEGRGGERDGGREREATYVFPTQFLLLIQLALVLVDSGPEAVRIPAKGNVEILQEAITPRQQTLGNIGFGLNRGLAVEDDDPVCEVGGHDEIVLDDESRLLGVHDEALDDSRGDDTLFGVQIGGGFVDEVDVRR